MGVPEDLTYKIEIFRETGRLVQLPGDFFQDASWLALMLGQGIIPWRNDPLADLYDSHDLRLLLEKMNGIIRKTAEELPMQDAFIDTHCRPPG